MAATRLSTLIGRFRWQWAVAWAWIWHYSSDQMRYEIRQLGRDPESYTQGETPHRILNIIAEKTGMGPGIRVLDVGCGRGSALAFWSVVYGTDSMGIEAIPELVAASRALFEAIGMTAELIQGDFSQVMWPVADVIFVAGTCFSAKAVRELYRRLMACETRVKIAMITLELPSDSFLLIDEVPVRFSWGRSMVRVYGRRI